MKLRDNDSDERAAFRTFSVRRSRAAREIKILAKERGKISSLRTLPEHYQLAVLEYFGSGEEWPLPKRIPPWLPPKQLKKKLPKRFWNKRFGVVSVSTSLLIRQVRFPYSVTSKSCPVYSKRNRWPVILDKNFRLEDGYHRLSCYLHQGVQTVPALYRAK
jgi:hypothetical protein